jgi:hypothetical protein
MASVITWFQIQLIIVERAVDTTVFFLSAQVGALRDGRGEHTG